MTIKDAISTRLTTDPPTRIINAAVPIIEALPMLLDTPDRQLGIEDHGTMLGVVTEASMLDTLGRLIVPRDDSSVITAECPADHYSASAIAHAVEDADSHLVDLLTGPAQYPDAGMPADAYNDRIRITLRVRTLQPEHVIQSLERYGYTVVDTGGRPSPEAELFAERLASLNTLLNV